MAVKIKAILNTIKNSDLTTKEKIQKYCGESNHKEVTELFRIKYLSRKYTCYYSQLFS